MRFADNVREAVGDERIRFSPTILPPYARRTKSLDVLIPILYLKGISSGDFEEALAALLGKDAGGLSASTIGRLKDAWLDEHLRWSERDLSAKRYVYFWADGIHVQARLEDDAVPARDHWCDAGRQEGARRPDRRHARERAIVEGTPARSQTTWTRDRAGTRGRRRRARFLEGASRGMAQDARATLLGAQDRQRPQQAAEELQGKAKRALQNIWMAETKHAAEAPLDMFVEIYGVKYDKAVECLTKNRDVLLTFYDFPAEHWKHLRTTNPIESTFATVRHRTTRSKGCLSNKTALAMTFKLAQSAEASWNRLRGYNQLSKIIMGVKFKDGVDPSPRFGDSSQPPSLARFHEARYAECERYLPAKGLFAVRLRRVGGSCSVSCAVNVTTTSSTSPVPVLLPARAFPAG
jgi:hypothetical protein